MIKKIIYSSIFSYLIFFTIIFLESCEGYEIGIGTVYDNATKLPLDSVHCITNGNDEIYTDSTGKFNLHGPFGGCVRNCRDIEIEFSKKKYKTIKLNKDFENVYLDK